MSPCERCGDRGAVPWRINPWRVWPASGLERVLRKKCERHKVEEAHKVSGEDSEKRTNPRRALGSLSGT